MVYDGKSHLEMVEYPGVPVGTPISGKPQLHSPVVLATKATSAFRLDMAGKKFALENIGSWVKQRVG